MPLFKVKNSICEITHHDAFQIAVNKIDKKVYFVDDSELRLVCKLMPSGNMEWEEEIDETIRAQYVSLIIFR